MRKQRVGATAKVTLCGKEFSLGNFEFDSGGARFVGEIDSLTFSGKGEVPMDTVAGQERFNKLCEDAREGRLAERREAFNDVLSAMGG